MRPVVSFLAVFLASASAAMAADKRAAVPADAMAGLAHRASVLSPPAGDPDEGLTRSQALRELERAGFKVVTRLVKDDDGNWIGAARHQGRIVDVAVDRLGGVVAW